MVKNCRVGNRTLYPSVLDFWEIKFEKSSSRNWTFTLKKSFLKLIFSGYTSSKNPVLRVWFFQIDFSKVKYRWIGWEGSWILLCLAGDERLSKKSLVFFIQHLWKQMCQPGNFFIKDSSQHKQKKPSVHSRRKIWLRKK